MPEGDTVWRAARKLDRALSGQVLEVSDFRVPSLATVDVTGSPVVATISRGKHLLTRIGDDVTLHTHLKMEGSWHVHRRGEEWHRPAHQARVVLAGATTEAVGFSLGIVELVARDAEDDLVGHLGPDLLGPDWDEDEAVRRLLADPARPVVDALRDQTCLAGIGNMYAAELCFTAGLHPGRPLGEVAELRRLVRRAKAMLELNKDRARQATTGDLRQGHQFWVYRRDKQACRRCGTTIRVETRGPLGRERASYWCPSCQPSEQDRP